MNWDQELGEYCCWDNDNILASRALHLIREDEACNGRERDL
jgi:hypothetical protein